MIVLEIIWGCIFIIPVAAVGAIAACVYFAGYYTYNVMHNGFTLAHRFLRKIVYNDND